jgi:hypothetical protein
MNLRLKSGLLGACSGALGFLLLYLVLHWGLRSIVLLR